MIDIRRMYVALPLGSDLNISKSSKEVRMISDSQDNANLSLKQWN